MSDDNRGLFAHLLVNHSMNWSTNYTIGPPILVDQKNILDDQFIDEMTNK